MSRLTYKSSMGDYGSCVEYDNPYDEIQALRNALGKYEDLNFCARDLIRDYSFLVNYLVNAKLMDNEDKEKLLNTDGIKLLKRMIYL